MQHCPDPAPLALLIERILVSSELSDALTRRTILQKGFGNFKPYLADSAYCSSPGTSFSQPPLQDQAVTAKDKDIKTALASCQPRTRNQTLPTNSSASMEYLSKYYALSQKQRYSNPRPQSRLKEPAAYSTNVNHLKPQGVLMYRTSFNLQSPKMQQNCASQKPVISPSYAKFFDQSKVVLTPSGTLTPRTKITKPFRLSAIVSPNALTSRRESIKQQNQEQVLAEQEHAQLQLPKPRRNKIPEIKIPEVTETGETIGTSTVVSPLGSSGIPSPFSIRPLPCRKLSSRRVIAPLVSDAKKLKKVQSERRLPTSLMVQDPVNFEEVKRMIESDSDKLTDMETCISPVQRYLYGFFQASAAQKEMPPTPCPVVRKLPLQTNLSRVGHVQPVTDRYTSEEYFATTTERTMQSPLSSGFVTSFPTRRMPTKQNDLTRTRDSLVGLDASHDEFPVLKQLPPMLQNVPSPRKLLAINRSILRSEKSNSVSTNFSESTVTDLAAGIRRAIEREKQANAEFYFNYYAAQFGGSPLRPSQDIRLTPTPRGLGIKEIRKIVGRFGVCEPDLFWFVVQAALIQFPPPSNKPQGGLSHFSKKERYRLLKLTPAQQIKVVSESKFGVLPCDGYFSLYLKHLRKKRTTALVSARNKNTWMELRSWLKIWQEHEESSIFHNFFSQENSIKPPRALCPIAL